jgi:hypothetical protein
LGNMQSKDGIDTYLPADGYWIVINDETDNIVGSNNIESIAASMGLQMDTLVSLFGDIGEGLWPAMLGGKTFKLSVTVVSPGLRIATFTPLTPDRLADILTVMAGNGSFILSTSGGRVLAMSKEASAVFKEKEKLISLFDSASSGAIQAAMKKCVKQGSVPDFIVSRSTGGGSRSNYTLSMRKLPSPGKLILCHLSIPSVAVVTKTMNRRGLVGVLLEESFCPALVIDSQGVISSMNEMARGMCQQMWGSVPTGSSLFEYIHPDHRKTIELRHEQRKRGYSTSTRFSVKLKQSLSGSDFIIDISVVPIPETDQSVVFARTKPSPSNDGMEDGGIVFRGLLKLLTEENSSLLEILEATANLMGATSGAFVHEGEVVTVGDSRKLVELLDPVQLAASPCGLRKDGVFLHRIHSGFSISHLVFLGIEENPLSQLGLAVLYTSSRILAERESTTALREWHHIITTVKAISESFLKKTEPLEGLLSDLAKECRAETAVVFKVNTSGTVLKGIGASGVVGMLPDLHIEALNTASWACIRGETAFFAETPEDDLRFSPVFPNSRSELAVPYFNGSTTDGVILLASTETEAFHYVETELIQMMAILFTSPENGSDNGIVQSSAYESNRLKQKELEYIVHNITALLSASRNRLDLAAKKTDDGPEMSKNIKHLSNTVTRLGYFSKWTLWWLKISVYNGLPEHRWINPIPLLEKVMQEFRSISEREGIELNYLPPENDIEVCTDGAFVSMIAYSLLMCVSDNCRGCESIDLAFGQLEDHWSFTLETTGGSVPAHSLTTHIQPVKENMAFSLAWKLTEELGGTINTFSNRGKTTRMVVRLKVSG